MLWVLLFCVIEGLCSAERPMNSPESDTHAIQRERERERKLLFSIYCVP